MRKNDPVSKLMVTDLVTIQVGESLSKARQLLSDGNFHHLPVLDGKALVGVLSSADMLRLSFDAFGTDDRTMDHVLDQQFKLQDVMTKVVTTLFHKETVRDAVDRLKDGSIHSLPVVNENRELVGIVTSTDLIRYLSKQYA